MTKCKKRIMIFAFLGVGFALAGWLIYIFFISDAPLSVTYTECARYDDFDSVQADFESIATAAAEHGDGIYYLEKDGLSKLDYPDITKIQTTESERDSIKQIQMYSSDNTAKRLGNVVVKNDNIEFEYDAIGCGIVKTEDIKGFIKSFSTNNDYGYTKLAKNWYAYYC